MGGPRKRRVPFEREIVVVKVVASWLTHPFVVVVVAAVVVVGTRTRCFASWAPRRTAE